MFVIVEDEQVTEETDALIFVNIVAEWKGMLAEGTVV